MSAIFGLIFFDGKPVDSCVLERMGERLAHRGISPPALWKDGHVGVGHVAFYPHSGELGNKQPVMAASGHAVLTLDGRIDNREALRVLLGSRFREATDAELVLAAYERWGEGCTQHLIGDFAFGLWDRREHRFFCARDHFGARPFYYYHSERVFAFASEIKALLQLEGVPREINELRVAQYLEGDQHDKENTFYRDIWRLPAAHMLHVRDRHLQKRTYWSLDVSREVNYSDTAEYVAAFRELFMQAVRARLPAHLPVGSELSGGLDSSSVTVMAQQVSQSRPFPAFSMIFPHVAECDEQEYIRTVREASDIDLHFVDTTDSSLFDGIDDFLWHVDEPCYWPTWPAQRKLFIKAREEGVRFLLSGFGGDQVVSYGQGYLAELVRHLQFRSLVRELRAWSPSPSVSLLRYGMLPLVRAQFPGVVRRVKQALGRGDGLEVIRPELDRRVGYTQAEWKWRKKTYQCRRSARGYHIYMLGHGLFQSSLEMVDKACLGQSVRYLSPFYDKRLVEFCVALPIRQKRSEEHTRLVLRRAMQEHLPDKVRWRRSKAVFNAFSLSLLHADRRRVNEVLQEAEPRLRHWIDHDLLQMFSSHPSNSRRADVPISWKEAEVTERIVYLAYWLESNSL